jgi:hypothetical protein
VVKHFTDLLARVLELRASQMESERPARSHSVVVAAALLRSQADRARGLVSLIDNATEDVRSNRAAMTVFANVLNDAGTRDALRDAVAAMKSRERRHGK